MLHHFKLKVRVYVHKYKIVHINTLRAQKNYDANPRYCKLCNTKFSHRQIQANYRKKFCNSSCAASYNNIGRVRTQDSKLKTSTTLKNRPTVTTKCIDCNSQIFVKKILKEGNLCNICYSNRSKNIWCPKGKKYSCIKCNKAILKNKTNLCKECWIISEDFEKQRGNYLKTFQKGYYFCKKENKDVYLNSSLEFAFAEYCDKNNIEWSKPRHLTYTLNDKQHYYFPDFYLNKHNLIIEIKGYFWKNDLKKMQAVLRDNKDKNIKIIQQKELKKLINGEINFNYCGMGELVDPPGFEPGAE